MAFIKNLTKIAEFPKLFDSFMHYPIIIALDNGRIVCSL